MYAVSSNWINAQSGVLASEGFVEISCYIPELQTNLIYTKDDLLSFSHQQSGSIISAELPKNHIEFSLDNSDGRWNPSNPRGLERYLSERLKITLRYGVDVAGTVEWIPGGVFYLSEWNTSLNGLEASFVARDIFEYMLDQPYTGEISGTLYDLATNALAESNLPADAVVSLCDELKNYSVGEIEYNGEDTVAIILQKCANAACCVMGQDRYGVFSIKRIGNESSDYVIPINLSYAYPEVELLRPLKAVSATYGGGKTETYFFYTSGETQTLTNNFISTSEQAKEVSKWVCDSLRARQKISGNFRSDLRMDLYDIVSVANKYGIVYGVVLTEIKVTFSGAFRTTYKGQVCVGGVTTNIYSGEIYMGEVV